MSIRYRQWRLPVARPFGSTMKPLTSAQTAIHIRPDGRRELTISHDVIKGSPRPCYTGGSVTLTPQ